MNWPWLTVAAGIAGVALVALALRGVAAVARWLNEVPVRRDYVIAADEQRVWDVAFATALANGRFREDALGSADFAVGVLRGERDRLERQELRAGRSAPTGGR